jgi:hypothetical protein
VFGRKVLRKIFVLKRDEVTRDWRKLDNDELHDFYSSPNIIRIIKLKRMRWAEHLARMWRSVYRILARNREGNRSLGRLRRMWEDNVKTDLVEI